MKKIGILTLPPKTNYGGILQLFALQTFLKSLGYESWFIRRKWNSQKQSRIHKILKYLYHHIVIYRFDHFITHYIVPQTKIIDTPEQMNSLMNYHFDGFVVGSDQIWRMRHVYGVDYNYFLDFTNEECVKRISYAASFGVDYWDDPYPDKSIPIVKNLLHRFNAISVREDSGIKVCKEIFDVNAVHVLDPTLLLDKELYINAFRLNIAPQNYLGVYILDMTKEKQALIDYLSGILNLPVRYINKKNTFLSKIIPGQVADMLKPGVIEWVKSLAEASFVLTDSFHGTAFSIIFERQFYAIGNKERGLTRFESLLCMLNLSDRLITENCNMISPDIPINYNRISRRKSELQTMSANFIRTNL